LFHRLDGTKTQTPIARFGANVISHCGKIYIVGGIIRDQILKSVDEISVCDGSRPIIFASSIILDRPASSPRPLLIGTTAISIADSLVITGGSAVCFSFGSFWNKGCLTLLPGQASNTEYLNTKLSSWFLQQTFAPKPTRASMPVSIANETSDQNIISVPRVTLELTSDFIKYVNASKPVIFENMALGTCKWKWTTEYLKEAIGVNREVQYFQTYLICLFTEFHFLGYCSRM
jgi:tRNA wybutosine-synthesizing protein 4